MQFEPVEAAFVRPACCAHEVGLDAFHVGARHCPRELVMRAIGNGGRGEERPVARRQRLIGLFPAQLRRALRSRVTELHRDFRRRAPVHVVDDTLPRLPVLILVHAGAAGRNAGIGGNAGHFREHQPGAAVRAAAQMHKVIIVGRTVGAGILRHRRYDDPIRKRDSAQREWREHRRYHIVAGDPRRRASLREPVLEACDVTLVAQAQILVGDALAAREQAVRELLGFQPGVALDVLEPFGRVARRVLDLQHFDRALGFVGHERVDQVGLLPDGLRQGNRVLQRKLGARADREVRRVCGIAHEHDRRRR